HARRSGNVERRAVAERGDRSEVLGPEPAAEQRVPEELGERPELRLAGSLRRIGYLATGEGRVVLVDGDRNVPLGAELFRVPDVVAVTMRQDERPDVLDRAAHRRQLSRQVAIQAGEARIDDRDLTRLLHEIGVDDALVADAADAVSDLHTLAA